MKQIIYEGLEALKDRLLGNKPPPVQAPAPTSPTLPDPEDKPPPDPAVIEAVKQRWQSLWQDSLTIWSKYVRLSEPIFCVSDEEAAEQGLMASFAGIRLDDHRTVINLQQVVELGIEDFPLEVMAHEIGHHVLTPGDATDLGRMIARMRKGLRYAHMFANECANMYEDLLINNRLYKTGLDMAGVHSKMAEPLDNELFLVYLRIYELLYNVPPGTIAQGTITDTMERDADIGKRIIQVYGQNWMSGAKRFATLLRPYFEKDKEKLQQEFNQYMNHLMDALDAVADMVGKGMPGNSQQSGKGKSQENQKQQQQKQSDSSKSDRDKIPAGLTATDDEEEAEVNPDPNVPAPSNKPPSPQQSYGGSGQYREPFEYQQLMESMGIKATASELSSQYYQERALPHLVKVPMKIIPHSTDLQPEALEQWECGEALEEIDWIGSVMQSPIIIPGSTTAKRHWDTIDGNNPDLGPVDIDIYIDSSGSMPDPRHNTSYLTLCGAIVALSALRVGAKVQATLWSGAGEYTCTNGFTRNVDEIMDVITGSIGGSTAFPLNVFSSTYESRRLTDTPVHILVISDEGIDTMYQRDHRGKNGFDVAQMALDKARAGGSLVLNLSGSREYFDDDDPGDFKNLAIKQGWDWHKVSDWEELEEFGRRFSQLRYGT